MNDDARSAIEERDVEVLANRIGLDARNKCLVLDTGRPLEVHVVARFLSKIFPDTFYRVIDEGNVSLLCHNSPEMPGAYFVFTSDGNVDIIPYHDVPFTLESAKIWVQHAARIVVMSRNDANRAAM